MISAREQGDAAFLAGYLDGLSCRNSDVPLDVEDRERLRAAARMLTAGYDIPHLGGHYDHDDGEG